MKDDVDLVERGRDRFTIANIAFDEFRFGINPIWFSALVRVRL